jgi:hypothetical protein
MKRTTHACGILSGSSTSSCIGRNNNKLIRTTTVVWILGAALALVWVWSCVSTSVMLLQYRRIVVDDDDPNNDATTGLLGFLSGDRFRRLSSDDHDGKKKELVLWSPRETYFEDCRQTMLHNDTWGAARAPLVDKIQAKHWAREWSRSVQIVPTLAIFDDTNISSLNAMDALLRRWPQPFVIKPAHLSGGIALVQNDTYQIVKNYLNIVAQSSRVPLSMSMSTQIGGVDDAERYHRELINVTMRASYSDNYGEMQYQRVPHRMLVEQALDMSRFRDVTYWYMANGTPIFVSMECTVGDASAQRAFFTAQFRPLSMRLTYPRCTTTPVRPKSWEAMRTIAMELSRHIPDVVRVDRKYF